MCYPILELSGSPPHTFNGFGVSNPQILGLRTLGASRGWELGLPGAQGILETRDLDGRLLVPQILA